MSHCRVTRGLRSAWRMDTALEKAVVEILNDDHECEALFQGVFRRSNSLVQILTSWVRSDSDSPHPGSPRSRQTHLSAPPHPAPRVRAGLSSDLVVCAVTPRGSRMGRHKPRHRPHLAPNKTRGAHRQLHPALRLRSHGTPRAPGTPRAFSYIGLSSPCTLSIPEVNGRQCGASGKWCCADTAP